MSFHRAKKVMSDSPGRVDFAIGLVTRGGTLGISGWGCATGTLEPLAYARASSSEFCYPLLD